MIELGEILEGMVQRTSEGKLKWSRSVGSDRFVTSIDAISGAIIDSGYSSINGENYYRLDILEESGDIIDSLGYQDTSREQDEQLARLYVLARRSAHNIDSVLEKLARGLDLK